MSSWRPAWHEFSCLHEDPSRSYLSLHWDNLIWRNHDIPVTDTPAKRKIFSLTQAGTVLWQLELYYACEILFWCLVRYMREYPSRHIDDLMLSRSLYLWFWYYNSSHIDSTSRTKQTTISNTTHLQWQLISQKTIKRIGIVQTSLSSVMVNCMLPYHTRHPHKASI